MAANLLIGAAMLTGCTPSVGDAPTEPAPAQIAKADRATPLPDLTPCPGINPDIRRPAGSNCLGITPDRCGADAVQQYVGQQGTPELRERIAKATNSATAGDLRWIPRGTPVIEDLRAHRINIELDEAGVIERIDCY
ncbi:I78 family peptidase inhibitor [Erythrobacter sp. MTPC3]|uniref:I78 family peptidase inhibitor n=1 Tax=Erythrobacter sp. MTPC3 TaxID=3056564 RepID=UPI0036F3DEAC